MIPETTARPLTQWSALPQLILHQAGWWACVIWMGWLGPAVMTLFLCVHLGVSRSRLGPELTLIGVATIVGVVLDSALALGGAVTYVGDLKVWESPLWLVAIWAGFGATLMHSQAILVRTRLIAVLTGALGGPAAYWGGERLERMTVDPDVGWLAVGLAWTIAMAILHTVASNLRSS